MTIFEAQRRINGFDLIRTVAGILQQDELILKDLNKKQLYKGKRSDGSLIRPVYASDAYAAKKNRETPDADRPPYTPNLYLTGKFYNSIYVKVTDQIITFGSNDDINGLEAKYTSLIFGLNTESKIYYIDNYLWPQLRSQLDILFN